MSDSGIIVEDLTFRYPGSDDIVLDTANLTISHGEFTAIIGGNGSGKTTLCKTFNGLIPHFFEGTFEGRVTVDGIDTRESDVAGLSQRVGYVFQDFENQLVEPTVLDDVAFAPLNHGVDDYEERAMKALEAVGLEETADRFIWELSGGQQHLVALAGVLAMDPDFVIVDEPAAQLDPYNARDTYEQLQSLHESGTTVIVIEHHSEFIADYCENVVMVKDGGVAWKRPVEEGLNRIEELRSADIHPPQTTQIADGLPEGMGSLPDGRLPITVAEGVRYLPNAHELDPSRSPAADGRGEGDPLISMDGVTHGYPTLRQGRNTVLEEFDLEFHRGDRVALVGPNGSGKSTILRLLTGLESPEGGTVTVLGQDTTETLPETLSDDVVYIHQNPEEMFVEDTVRKDVAYYLRNRNASDVEDRVDEIMSYLDIEHLADRDGRLLSLGQQRRASLAIGLATDPTVVLLDEPTGSLDLASRREVTKMLERTEKRVETVIMASHDLQLVAAWADRVIVLASDGVLSDAPPREVFNDTAVLERSNLRPPQVVELSDALDITPPALDIKTMIRRLREMEA